MGGEEKKAKEALRELPYPEVPFQVLHILQKLRQANHQAFIVGGAVRDALTKRPIRDWDICTSAKVDSIRSLFPKVIPIGARHGTVTVMVGNLTVEVSSFRGRTIVEDLGHRDFTVDAMAWDPYGPSLVDPFGGEKDLEQRLLRGVAEPFRRFLEDPLRPLRGIRLAGELGLEIEPETKRAMGQAACLLERIAKERILEELDRILLLASPAMALLYLWETRLLLFALPELAQESSLEKEGLEPSFLEHLALTLERLPQNRSLRWAGVFHRLGVRLSPYQIQGLQEGPARAASSALTRLRAPSRLKKEVSYLILHHALDPHKEWSWAEARELILHLGREYALGALSLRRASLEAWLKGREKIAQLVRLEEMVQSMLEDKGSTDFLKPALDGREVMELLKMDPGPKLGEIIREMRREIARHPELNTRERLKDWLLSRYPHQSPA